MLRGASWLLISWYTSGSTITDTHGEDIVVADFRRMSIKIRMVHNHALIWHVSQSRRKLSNTSLQAAQHVVNCVFDDIFVTADRVRVEIG